MKAIELKNFDVAQLRQAQEVFASLHGRLASLQMDVSDPESVRRAFVAMEGAIDKKIAAYRHNPLVMGMAEELKKQYRTDIFKLAADPLGLAELLQGFFEPCQSGRRLLNSCAESTVFSLPDGQMRRIDDSMRAWRNW